MIQSYRKPIIWLIFSVLSLQTLVVFADTHHVTDMPSACFIEQMHVDGLASSESKHTQHDESHHDGHCCHGQCAHHLISVLTVPVSVALSVYNTHLLPLRLYSHPSHLLRPPQV